MKLEQSFEVSAPIERVWQALIDVEHVAPCLPGAAVTGRNDDGTYNGTFSLKIGPTTATYTGKLEMKEIDEAAHEATMHAHGNDKRGQGGANATIHSKVFEEKPGETRVEVATDYHITGRLARFGRGGMIEDISERLLREFATRLQASLTQEPEKQTGAHAAPDANGEPEKAEVADESPAPLHPEPTSPAPAASLVPEPPPVSPAAPLAPEPPPVLPTASLAPEPPPVSPATPLAPEPPPVSPAAPLAPEPPPPPSAAQPPQANEPIQGASLVGSVLWERVRRNPSPIAFVLGLVLAFVLLRRRRH
jgi:uncharacterized protein